MGTLSWMKTGSGQGGRERKKERGYIYIYIYAFSRRFYPKRLTLHSSYSYLLSLGIEPMILTFASAMLYQLSYRKAKGKMMTAPGSAPLLTKAA